MFIRKLILGLVVASTLVAGGLASPVTAAPDDAPTNATNASASSGAMSASDWHQADVRLSGTTRITEWRLQGGTFDVKVESEVPTYVTLVDASALARALSEGEGAASSSVRKSGYNVAKGTTTIHFTASEYGGMRAFTATAANGDRLGIVRTSALEAVRDAIPYATARNILLLAVVGSVGGTVCLVRRKMDDEERDVRRER